MEDLLYQYSHRLPVLLLIFFRVLGLFIMSPIFSRHNIPTYWKIIFSVFLTYMVFSFYGQDTRIDIGNAMELSMLIIKEVFLGFVFGYITTVVFSAVLLAGQLIDTQIGFGMVNILDPQNNIQIPLIGNFNNIIALMLFLIMDGHHALINLLVSSFEMIPIGRFVIDPDIYKALVLIFRKAFELAFKISLPIVGAALVTEGALGLMAKSIPQINIFAIGIPVKIFVGLVTLYFFISTFVALLGGSFTDMLQDMKNLIEMMAVG